MSRPQPTANYRNSSGTRWLILIFEIPQGLLKGRCLRGIRPGRLDDLMQKLRAQFGRLLRKCLLLHNGLKFIVPETALPD